MRRRDWCNWLDETVAWSWAAPACRFFFAENDPITEMRTGALTDNLQKLIGRKVNLQALKSTSNVSCWPTAAVRLEGPIPNDWGR